MSSKAPKGRHPATVNSRRPKQTKNPDPYRGATKATKTIPKVTSGQTTNTASSKDKTAANSGKFTTLKSWLSLPIVGALIGIIAIVLGTVLATVYWWWPHSPSSPSVVPINGGKNPSTFFNGNSSAQISTTQLILFSPTTVANHATVQRMGAGLTTTCAKSLAETGLQGVYRCVSLDSSGVQMWAADPCFGETNNRVVCAMPDGSLYELNVLESVHIKPYHASLDQIGNDYPWRLELANGLDCSWDWWDKGSTSSTSGRWMCSKPPGSGVILLPAWHNGDIPADYYKFITIEIPNLESLAVDLNQGTNTTWSVLIERGNDPGDYTRIDVKKAWY
jgi:hypothetical protein